MTVCRNDKWAAINRAIAALKERNYQGAVEAYRKYDSKWGFAPHIGEKYILSLPITTYRAADSSA